MNRGWKEYLNFSRKETFGIVLLLAIILMLALLPVFFEAGKEELNTDDFEKLRKELLSLQDSADRLINDDSTSSLAGFRRESAPLLKGPENSKAEVFEFDPNTLSAEGWEKLGVQKKTIATIQKYLARGGIFRTPSDIAKIYGLSGSDKERLIPYVRILNKDSGVNKRSDKWNTNKYRDPGTAANIRGPLVIDINRSDTSAWISLPGIGGKLAARIVKFREKLGGFHSVEQVSEIYGLQDSVFQKIRSFLSVLDPELQKLNINQLEEAELDQHPYISRDLARSIVHYRLQHGKFASLQDLMQLANMTPETYRKLEPYLSI